MVFQSSFQLVFQLTQYFIEQEGNHVIMQMCVFCYDIFGSSMHRCLCVSVLRARMCVRGGVCVCARESVCDAISRDVSSAHAALHTNI